MESDLNSLQRELDALGDRLQRRQEEFRHVKFADTDGQKEITLRALLQEDMAEMDRIANRVQTMKGVAQEVERDWKNLERVVLGMATAALGLTVTFSGNLVPETPSAIAWLIAAWVALAGTVVAFPLGSLLEIFSRLGLLHRGINGHYISGMISGLGYSLFIVGIISFVVFAISNLPSP